MKNILRLTALIVFMFSVNAYSANEFKGQARLFLGSSSNTPSDVNTVLTAENLKNVDSIGVYGVELLYPLASILDVGFRYTRHSFYKDELNSNAFTDYSAELSQDSVMGVARMPFFKTAIIRADVFGAFGGSNTTINLKTASQNGEFTRKAEGAWVATPCYSFGASVAVGYKQYYFFVEGGLETNKVDNFTTTGTITSTINTLDLSGTYIHIGLLFDGVPISQK